ncbi:SGNH/GDSL hydrolase family protein [Undibacterium sp. Ren11W]|uniref:SGNH/GDSL hydrolase family protein n=1 Tax=Undibacterium sp. Ren11W TaxID=3413045 RepID=UPI003BF10725
MTRLKLFSSSLWATTLLFFVSSVMAQAAPVPPSSTWVAGWMAAPDGVGPALKPVTIRQVVRTSVGGTSVRLRFSNLLGTEPLILSSVHVALHAGGGAIVDGCDRLALFNGVGSVTIAPGSSVASDPVPLPVKALAQLAVSLYLPMGASLPTLHGNGAQTAYLIEAKDVAGLASISGAQIDDSRYFLTDVEVAAPSGTQTLVVVGDSVTDGVESTQDGNARWPDFLANRLQGTPAAGTVAVVNAGIAGNRVLNDFGAPYVGPSTLNRFQRDVLNKPGLRWIILMQGINDISASELLTAPKDQVSAQQIIDGMKLLIARAHAQGVKIWAGTLLPREGATRPLPHSANMEAKRQAVNLWIRTGEAFDGIIDFDLALRDPAHPARQLKTLNSGDFTHPNDAGYMAMANAVDLVRLLKE